MGIVALPLAMAFAIASGVSPAQGLYTAIISGLIVGLLGGSRVQIAGPTGAFIVILAGITAEHGVQGLQTATLLAGFILLFMGIIKLGNVIRFIPEPVIVGFTSGIGVIIFVSEWNDFFGLSLHMPLDTPFHVKLMSLIHALPKLDGAAEKIERALAIIHFDPKIIIFRLKNVPFMDMTGLQTFREIIEAYHHRNVQVYLCEANFNVQKKLDKLNISHSLARNQITETLNELLQDLRKNKTLG